jgi:hypothetical protein
MNFLIYKHGTIHSCEKSALVYRAVRKCDGMKGG